jgi:hypothetical protein
MSKIKQHKSFVLPAYALCTKCKINWVKMIYKSNNYVPICKNCRKFNK